LDPPLLSVAESADSVGKPAYPGCGGRLRLLETIEERAVVEQSLTHLGLPADPPQPSAARTSAWIPGVRRAADHEPDSGAHWAD